MNQPLQTFGPEELKGLFAALKVTAHPVLPLPSLEQVRTAFQSEATKTELIGFLRKRQERIGLMELDPLNYGFRPPMWSRADELIEKYRRLLVTGPNRIGKTEWAAAFVDRLIASKKDSRFWCLCQSHETSIRGGGQQEVIWKYLPPEWKALNHVRDNKANRGNEALGTASISYGAKNRFSDSVFIGPQGQECRFMNYEQDIKVIEGGSIDGYWADELVPVEWIKTLDGRLVDRNGVGIVTFTPIYGWNETVGLHLQGGKVLETREFPLFPELRMWPGLPPGQIPYVMESIDGKRATIFFQLRENPYVSWEALVKAWSSSSVPEQLIRLAGVTQKKAGNQFPKFGKHNIVPAAQVPKEGTNYHLIDFAWNKNWAMIWIRVQRIKDKLRIFIYRDWPDKKTHGEWAIRSSKPNGDKGPAQAPVGHSIAEYKQVILQLEGHKRESFVQASAPAAEGGASMRRAKVYGRAPGVVLAQAREGGGSGPEEIYQRYGDPRSGAATVVTESKGGTCILDMMGDVQTDAPAMEVLPAKGVLIGEGINLIRSWMEYDEEREIDIMNEPEFFVSEECEQVIECLQLWTGKGSEAEQHSKDFVDLLRYAAVMEIDDIGGAEVQIRQGRGF